MARTASTHSSWCTVKWGSGCPVHNGKHKCFEMKDGHPAKHSCMCGVVKN